MSRDEEHEIAVRFVETGDQRLADRLANANLRLVVKLALEYRVSRRNLTDLIQEGNLGLIHAIEKYDPHRGIKLATYAAWWIRAYMLQFMLANARLVRIGTTQVQRKLFFGMARARARLEAEGGEEVAPGQLAAALSVPEKDVVEMEQRLSSSDASLDRPVHENDDRDLMDCVSADLPAADIELESTEARRLIKRAVHGFGRGLTGRDRILFRRRLLCQQPATLASIATDFGVSRERIRQIEKRLKARLREHIEATCGEAVTEHC
jgi:RNA polymerase sigma-32 factor